MVLAQWEGYVRVRPSPLQVIEVYILYDPVEVGKLCPTIYLFVGEANFHCSCHTVHM